MPYIPTQHLVRDNCRTPALGALIPGQSRQVLPIFPLLSLSKRGKVFVRCMWWQRRGQRGSSSWVKPLGWAAHGLVLHHLLPSPRCPVRVCCVQPWQGGSAGLSPSAALEHCLMLPPPFPSPPVPLCSPKSSLHPCPGADTACSKMTAQ